MYGTTEREHYFQIIDKTEEKMNKITIQSGKKRENCMLELISFFGNTISCMYLLYASINSSASYFFTMFLIVPYSNSPSSIFLSVSHIFHPNSDNSSASVIAYGISVKLVFVFIFTAMIKLI